MRWPALIAVVIAWAGACRAEGCLGSQYIGFDSRVDARLVARLPVTDEEVVDFLVDGAGRPAVLLKSRLLLYDSSPPREIPVPGAATGLSLDADGVIRLQHGNSVDVVTPTGLQADPSVQPSGRLFASGRPVLLDVYDSAGVQKFVLRRPGSDSFGVGGARGELRAAFWGDAGLAAVVGRSLYAWVNESKQMARLAIDKGLANAQSVCMLGEGRAVVAFQRALVVVTEEDQIILAGMTARCDARKNTLHLLDEPTGEIWTVTGVDKLGNFRNDDRHARDLIRDLPAGANESAPAFLEAARIIGCDKARNLLAERPRK